MLSIFLFLLQLQWLICVIDAKELRLEWLTERDYQLSFISQVLSDGHANEKLVVAVRPVFLDHVTSISGRSRRWDSDLEVSNVLSVESV